MALFDEFGSEKTGLRYRGGTLGASNSYKQIDTVISVTGLTTGYSIDIPIRIIRAYIKINLGDKNGIFFQNFLA